MYLRRRFLESRKSVRLYLLCFQASAARPQPHDRIWCSSLPNSDRKPLRARYFCRSSQIALSNSPPFSSATLCEKHRQIQHLRPLPLFAKFAGTTALVLSRHFLPLTVHRPTTGNHWACDSPALNCRYVSYVSKERRCMSSNFGFGHGKIVDVDAAKAPRASERTELVGSARSYKLSGMPNGRSPASSFCW